MTDRFLSFRKEIYRYFERHGRSLPWRNGYVPYHILVSEVMLQQTQVDRVTDRFAGFIERFPDCPTLAAAPLGTVLKEWQGLGYNRRAVALREAAQIIVDDFGGCVPRDQDHLRSLPGIGPATAASIVTFAYNHPVVFLETNIRTVFIHHFFNDRECITDAEIFPLATAALDRRNPRKWYSALMDYGSMLKKRHGNLSRRSASYKKQSSFAGSQRQARGAILRVLLDRGPSGITVITREVGRPRGAVAELIDTLIREGFIVRTGRRYSIAG
jgi:A/G-specific adenine glycosylase